MIRGALLTDEERTTLTKLARDGLAEHRLARRANALVLLDQGWSCDQVGQALCWTTTSSALGIACSGKAVWVGWPGSTNRGHDCDLKAAQQDQLKTRIAETLPRTTWMVGAWIEREFAVVYESRSGLVALLHRLALEHCTPKAVSTKLDAVQQTAFIKAYQAFLNGLSDDETVLFADDAAHSTHGARAVGCWAPKDVLVALDQTSGRESLNLHGAIDLETGRTCVLDVVTVDAMNTIALLAMIEVCYPTLRLIHVFLDNARYHHAHGGSGPADPAGPTNHTGRRLI